MIRRRLILSSENPDKVAEIREIFGDAVELLPRPTGVPEVVEDADSLIGNARLKAVALVAATGVGAVADDTGLEVDALGGAPGVFTARFAGPDASSADNVARLLDRLDGVAAADRTARFRTVALIHDADGSELVAQGVVEGHILSAPQGTSGFGYDPVFAPIDADGLSFAEMPAAAKHAISHRGRAFRALTAQL